MCLATFSRTPQTQSPEFLILILLVVLRPSQNDDVWEMFLLEKYLRSTFSGYNSNSVSTINGSKITKYNLSKTITRGFRTGCADGSTRFRKTSVQ